MPFKNPEKRRASVRESVRRHRAAGGCKPQRKPLPDLAELRLETARDVVEALRDEWSAVRRDKAVGTLERARVSGFLASVLLRAFEQVDLVERIEALEQGVPPQRRAA